MERDDIRPDLIDESGKTIKPFATYLYDNLYADWQLGMQGWREKWLTNWYNFIGTYRVIETTRKNEGIGRRSKAFIKITKAKVMSAYAQILSIGFTGRDMFDIQPKLKGINRMIEINAKNMKAEIKEQLDEADFYEQVRTAILDLCLYGTLWMEGPTSIVRTAADWQREDVTQSMLAFGYQPQWSYKESRYITPTCHHRDIFYVYPDPYAINVNQAQGIIYAPFISIYELNDLLDVGGDKDIIKELIRQGPTTSDGADIIASSKDTERSKSTPKREGYQLLFYSGRVLRKNLGEELYKKLYPDEDVLVCDVNAFVVKGSGSAKLLKCVRNPYANKMKAFHRAIYESNNFELHGNGVASNMSDVQDVVNSATRLYIDSKAFAGIPMVGINKNLLRLKDNKLEVFPGKVFEFNGAPNQAMDLMTVQDSSDGLLRLIELMERYGDDTSGGGTKYTQGTDSRSLNRTASGISMIMNAASQALKTVGENIDDMVESLCDGFYQWNMEFSDRDDIKGNFIVSSNGISNAMSKEILNRQLLEFLGFVMNPQVYAVPGAMELLRRVGDNMGIKDVDSILPSREKVDQFAGASDANAMMGASMPEGGNMSGEDILSKLGAMNALGGVR